MHANGDLWGKVFWGFAFLFLLYRLFRGWQLGIIRQIVQIFALIAGGVSAFLFRGYAAPLLRPLGFPNIVNGAIAGVFIMIFVFVIVSFSGAVLFKKTSQQELSLVRVGYGIFGALLGLLFGLITLWILLIGLRLVGTFSQGANSKSPPTVKRAPPSAMNSGLANLKQSIDHGAFGGVVEKADPLSDKTYSLIDKLGKMISRPESVRRFLNYPGVHELSENPKVRGLLDDPEIMDDLRARKYFALLRNPHLVAAANDPKVQKQVKKIDLEKALDYALKQ